MSLLDGYKHVPIVMSVTTVILFITVVKDLDDSSSKLE